MNHSISRLNSGLFWRFPMVVAFSLLITSQGLLAEEESNEKETAGEQQDAKVEVRGGVRDPQKVKWSPRLTLISAIGFCGGFGWRAPRQVFLIRRGEKTAMDPRPILKGTRPDPVLEKGDIIEVPE